MVWIVSIFIAINDSTSVSLKVSLQMIILSPNNHLTYIELRNSCCHRKIYSFRQLVLISAPLPMWTKIDRVMIMLRTSHLNYTRLNFPQLTFMTFSNWESYELKIWTHMRHKGDIIRLNLNSSLAFMGMQSVSVIYTFQYIIQFLHLFICEKTWYLQSLRMFGNQGVKSYFMTFRGKWYVFP